MLLCPDVLRREGREAPLLVAVGGRDAEKAGSDSEREAEKDPKDFSRPEVSGNRWELSLGWGH